MSDLAAAISAFGDALKPKLSGIVRGAPEDQLRNPLETLVKDLAEASGRQRNAVHLVGEATQSDLRTRPDFAVMFRGALAGFIEVKAPGKGADPRSFTGMHDKEQWAKLSKLPNLLYTDGNSFSLWKDGVLQGEIVHLIGDVATSGAKLAAPEALGRLVVDFLDWDPIPPRSAEKLAPVAARLCRYLRDEVEEQLKLGNKSLSDLAIDWRKLLFPEANDAQFADGYAQAVTFGLLVARARGISLAGGIDAAAAELRKTSSLVGTALRLLTDDEANKKALATSLGALTRVLDAVDWPTISKGKPEAWLYFYQDFLQVYDNALRKRTGSYYTPPEVVGAMVRLVDDCLRGTLFEGRQLSLASADVTIADPAVGTGTFLLEVLSRIAKAVAADEGDGAVPGRIRDAAKRLVGFELQFGPFAVAQLRLVAEMRSLMTTEADPNPAVPDLRVFITDTLGNPFVAEDAWAAGPVRAIAESRKSANEIKKGERITVVIGNPPYKEKAEGRGGWIEAGPGRDVAAPMERWRPPARWGVGAHAKHLKNLYVFFWRWATWKVFGAAYATAAEPATVDREGIVCFITVAGFLNGPGFERMRDDLRRTCSAIWVVDASPEGHQPAVSTRIFEGVQQPVCIVLAARRLGEAGDQPAPVRFRSLPEGHRDDKLAALGAISLIGPGWREGPSGWRDPFLPAATGAWAEFPALADLFAYDGSGVMPGRTWAISPDVQSLRERWNRLTSERDPVAQEKLFHPQLRDGKVSARHIRKLVTQPLGLHSTRGARIIDDDGEPEQAIRYGFRSFDRQWILEDARLLNDVRPKLWASHSPAQVYLTALDASSPSNGPAITLTGLVPDQDHFHGRGGRVYPLWSDRAGVEPNIRPEFLAHLSAFYGVGVSAPDVMAYLAAVMAHPAFTARFAADLLQPGLRLPLTADPALFTAAAALGREVVWLHCYGERFADPAAGRPHGPPRAKDGPRSAVAIPGDSLPETMEYDASERRLHVGKGAIANVDPAVWAYEVSGKAVLPQWFSYRRRNRKRPIIGDRRPPSALEEIMPAGWLPEYTTDLINLLHVLTRLVALEPAQADLLERMVEARLIDEAELRAAGAIRPKRDDEDDPTPGDAASAVDNPASPSPRRSASGKVVRP